MDKVRYYLALLMLAAGSLRRRVQRFLCSRAQLHPEAPHAEYGGACYWTRARALLSDSAAVAEAASKSTGFGSPL